MVIMTAYIMFGIYVLVKPCMLGMLSMAVLSCDIKANVEDDFSDTNENQHYVMVISIHSYIKSLKLNRIHLQICHL